MEYERIHQVQTGVISPSKLRMKLMGPHHQKKKKTGGSNSNSARTSPSKLNEEDTDLFNNSLLEQQQEQEQEQVPRQFPKTDPTDDNLDYDSNASSSSFEFHKGGERSLHHSMAARSFSRPIPSKWNNAEKWIMNRQTTQFKFSKKPHSPQVHTFGHRSAMSNLVRVAPESSIHSDQQQQLSVKRVDFCVDSPIIDLCPDRNTNKDVSDAVPAIRSVSMRDMGTEMTPVPSQEPSRSVTPVSSTTPIRSSPTSSLPTTPRRGGGTTGIDDDNSKKELSEEEMKMKTRREIVALGVHLGKLNIAAWASKEEAESEVGKSELEKMEFEKRAAAWEEAQNSKHAASYKREEIKIEAWESQQKAKLEGEMRRMEAKLEQMRAHSQSKILKKIGVAKKRLEEKRMGGEERKRKDAERTEAQAEYIRRSGRIPVTSPLACCGCGW